MKKLTLNYIYNLIYQIITLIIPIITAPFLARTLRAEASGVYNYTASIVYWFTLVGMIGITMYGNIEIAKVRDEKEKLSNKFCEIFSLQFLTNLLSLLTYFIIFSFSKYDYRTVLLIQGVSIISTMFDISWFYYGIENVKKISIRNIIVKILNVIAIIILIRKPEDLILYSIISVTFTFLGQLMLWSGIKQYIDFRKVKFKQTISHLKPAFLLFVPQIAISIYSMLDRTMIGIFVEDISEVSFYTKAQQLVHMFLFVITSIGTVLMPRIVNMNAKNEKSKVLEYINRSFDLSLLLSFPMTLGLIAIAPFFVNWFLTVEYAKTAYLIMILAPIIVSISLTNVLGIQFLIPTNKTKEYTISVTASAIINFIFNLILIPLLNSYGAIIGTLIAEFSVLAIQVYYTKDQINFKEKIKIGIKYLSFSIIMFIVMYAIGQKMGISIVTNIIQFIGGSVIYLTLLIISKDNFIKYLHNLLKKSKGKE